MADIKAAFLQVPDAIGDVIFNIPAKSFTRSPYVYNSANTGVTGAVSSKVDPVTGVAAFSITSTGGTHVMVYSNVVAVAVRDVMSMNGGGMGGYSYFTHNEATATKWKELNNGLAEAEAERLKESEQTMVRALSVLTGINLKKAEKKATK